jgi:diaminopimelate epimerase
VIRDEGNKMRPRFTKFHGFGNDYIVLESEQLTGYSNLAEFSRLLCNRHYGAGADGIAVVHRVENDETDFQVRIFNPDGSEAALSGNGTRCAAAYLYFKGLWASDKLRLSTRAGIKKYVLVEKTNFGKYVFDSELGQPRFDSSSVPFLVNPPMERIIDHPLEIGSETFRITALQMGNPNCCIFVKNFDHLDWRRLGQLIENHKQFPDRTNVVFVRVQDRKTIELRIWERGVGETTASGTCSCAAAVASMIRGETDRSIDVRMPGGQARIRWREDGEIVINAPAELVYDGVWLAS